MKRQWWLELVNLVHAVLLLLFSLGMCLFLMGLSFFLFKFLWWMCT